MTAASENFWPLTSCMRHHLSSESFPRFCRRRAGALQISNQSLHQTQAKALALVDVVVPRFCGPPSGHPRLHVSAFLEPSLRRKRLRDRPLYLAPHCPTAVLAASPLHVFFSPFNENSVPGKWHRYDCHISDVSHRRPPM